MSETKFTKGPWNCEYGLVIIGNVHYEFFSNHDAALIAVAPEMYEEIERDIKILEREYDSYVLGSVERKGILANLNKKRNLLSKARGEHASDK